MSFNSIGGNSSSLAILAGGASSVMFGAKAVPPVPLGSTTPMTSSSNPEALPLMADDDRVEMAPHETRSAGIRSYNQPSKLSVQYHRMMGTVIDFNEIMMFGMSSEFLPELDKKFKETTDALEFSALQASLYANASDIKSDKEIQQSIQELIEALRNLFMDPFMTAADKMTAYYDSLSSIRDILAKNITADGKSDKGELRINGKEIFSALQSLYYTWSGAALYPANGSGVSKEEADDWRAKMGVGNVVSDGSGGYKVVIDSGPLDNILKVFADYKNGDNLLMSQTTYNNIMSSMDSFLQREQGKMNKVINQLDYYNKLINQVQEQLTDFFKRMTEVANNFLRV